MLCFPSETDPPPAADKIWLSTMRWHGDLHRGMGVQPLQNYPSEGHDWLWRVSARSSASTRLGISHSWNDGKPEIPVPESPIALLRIYKQRRESLFVKRELWGVSYPGKVSRIQPCQPVLHISVSGAEQPVERVGRSPMDI